MESKTHEAGTVAGCVNCREVVYEPGWYQMLRCLSEPEQPQGLLLVCGAPGTKAADPSPVAVVAEVRAVATSSPGF